LGGFVDRSTARLFFYFICFLDLFLKISPLFFGKFNVSQSSLFNILCNYCSLAQVSAHILLNPPILSLDDEDAAMGDSGDQRLLAMIPRLFPFMRNPLKTVRQAVVSTINCLLQR
jgi:hypothetical protein